MDNAGLEPIKGSSSCCPYHNCTDNQCKKRALNTKTPNALRARISINWEEKRESPNQATRV